MATTEPMIKQEQLPIGQEPPKHKYKKLARITISSIISELASNGIKLSVNAGIININIDRAEYILDISNNGNSFIDINNLYECLLLRITKDEDDYEMNDISMFNDGCKSVLDRSNKAYLFSLNGKTLSCIEVEPKIWKKNDKFPSKRYDESVIPYEFNIDEPSTPHEEKIKLLFKEITKDQEMNVAFRYELNRDKVEMEDANDTERYLEYKFRNIKTKLQIYQPREKKYKKIESKSIETPYCQSTPIELYYDTLTLDDGGIATEFYIGFKGTWKKFGRGRPSNVDATETRKYLNISDGTMKLSILDNMQKIPLKFGEVKTYYSKDKTPLREKIKSKLEFVGEKNTSVVIDNIDSIYHFTTETSHGNVDDAKNDMTEIILAADEESEHKLQWRHFLTNYICKPDKNISLDNQYILRIFERIRVDHRKKMKESCPDIFVGKNKKRTIDILPKKITIKSKSSSPPSTSTTSPSSIHIVHKPVSQSTEASGLGVEPSPSTTSPGSIQTVRDEPVTQSDARTEELTAKLDSTEVSPPLPSKKDRFNKIMEPYQDLRQQLKKLDLTPEELYQFVNE